MPIVKKFFGVDFDSEGGALTLCPGEVYEGDVKGRIFTPKKYTRTHPDGWTISGVVYSDWRDWVNEFEASHPVYGRVWGNFQNEVYADSEEGFAHFYENHKPDAWDYSEI